MLVLMHDGSKLQLGHALRVGQAVRDSGGCTPAGGWCCRPHGSTLCLHWKAVMLSTWLVKISPIGLSHPELQNKLCKCCITSPHQSMFDG